jgi:hypothetical protein
MIATNKHKASVYGRVSQPLEESGREELREQVIELRAQGLSIRKIAGRVGKSRSTISRWLALWDKEIARRRAIELEALYEQAAMTKEARIKRLSSQVKAIEKELRARGLEDVSTERLLRLLLEYDAALAGEYIETEPTAALGQSGDRMGSEQIREELERLLIRLRSGQISGERAKQEQAGLLSILRAIEQQELAEKIDNLETILEARP